MFVVKVVVLMVCGCGGVVVATGVLEVALVAILDVKIVVLVVLSVAAVMV